MSLGLFLCLLTACSSLDANNSRLSQYESYLDEHLLKQKMYLRLRETASAKVLLATPRSAELQALIVPGFELKSVSGLNRFVVSLEMPDWARFNISDFKFLLDGKAAKSIKEIMDGQLLQTLYPFSVPHDRAFVVEFEGEGASELSIQTSQGEFKFLVGKK